MKRDFFRKWVFVILPSLYLFFSFLFLSGIKRFYIGNFDPPYVYLFNGVNLAGGHFRVGNIVHPGTPVEIFAAIVIFVKHLFTGNTILYQDVLLHPESYLFTCSTVLAILLFLVTYFAGTYIYRHSGNILLSLLFQSSPLFFSGMVRKVISLSAESSIAIVGILFMAYLYVNTIASGKIPGKKTTRKNVVLFGLFTALLFTTKIYCAPIILLVLFLLKKWEQRLIYLVSSGIFSLLLLFPLYNQFRNWAGSIKAMIFHSGAYGQGSAGVLDVALYKSNSIDLFTHHYIFTAVYIFAIAAFLASLWIILKKRTNSANFILPVTGILLFFILFTLITIKQYKFDCPNPLTHTVFSITNFYYFILLICCFPIAIAVSYKILSPLISFEFFLLHKQKLLYGIFLGFIICGTVNTYKACYEARSQNVSYEKTRSFIDGWAHTPLIIVTDGGAQVRAEAALLVGSYFSGKWDMDRYLDFLKKAYPETYLYDIGWRDAVTRWGDNTNISAILAHDNRALVYISGTDSLGEETTLERICAEKIQKNKVNFKKIYSSDNKYESIYLVKPDSLP